MIPIATTSEGVSLLSRFKAVVFDLDDTLYPYRQYVLSGFRAVSRYVDNVYGRALYNDLVEVYAAGERHNVFGSALLRHFQQVDDRFLRNITHVYLAHSPEIKLYPDAQVAISLCFQRGVRTALVTTGHSGVQRRKVAALSLESLMDAVTHSDELIGTKGSDALNPDAFRVTALELGVEPGEMVYIADNPLADFVVPRGLGIFTVRVRRPQCEHATDEPPSADYAPDAAISSLDALAGKIALQRA